MTQYKVNQLAFLKFQLRDSNLLTPEQFLTIPKGNVIDISVVGRTQSHIKATVYIYQGHVTEIKPAFARHFSLSEFITSETALRKNINNTPPQEVIENLRALCRNVLDPLRERTGSVLISSGYRSPLLNKAVGGAQNSHHMKGWAADFTCPGLTVRQVFDIIKADYPFNELINEYDRWIHVSYNGDNKRKSWKQS